MSFLRLAFRSIVYYRRMHAGLLIGTALACAILTGALLVGESVDTTLRTVAGARLGRVTLAMDRTGRPFDDRLADNLRQSEPRLDVAAVLRLPGMLALPPERRDERDQLNRVQVLGVDGGFFGLAREPWPAVLGPQEIAVSGKVARALEVKPGDDLVLRVMRPNRMPLDAPLAARKNEPAAVSLVTVAAVVDDDQLGAFSLSANQIAPYNVFADRKWLQDLIEEPGLANLLLAGGGLGAAEAQRAIDAAWDLEQVGLRLTEHASGLLQLESDYIFIDGEAVRAALETPGARPILTYLVNSIAHDGRSTPYSFVQAGATPEDMPDDHAAISQWLAAELRLGPGDEFEMAYLKLRPDNTFIEEKQAFIVHSVVAMDELAVERDLAPQFPGLSDVESCSDWNIGMPMDDEMLKDAANEAYWREYRQTPKLLVTYEAGRRMWGNQFGEVTAVRFAPPGNMRDETAHRLRENIRPEKIGLEFTPVGQIAEKAVAQSMDFGGLFLGMSFFLIVAALILLGLLYVFGLQQRAPEFATLAALGFTPSRIRAVFMLESAPTALAGSAVGAIGGAAYAKLLLAGLARFWPAAVAGTPVEFYAGAGTMAAGGAAGLVCAMVVITVALWRFSRRSAHELLSTDLAAEPARVRRPALGLAAPTAALVPAVGLSLNVWLAEPRSYVLHFFGAGALVLIALLGYGRWLLIRLEARHSFARPSLWRLALVNLTRRRGRTLSVAGLTACGCFMVFAVSSMRENVALHAGDRSSGTGGFAVFAETTIPIVGTPADVAATVGAGAVPLRVRDGDDAGCLNLNRAQKPRLFGVNAETMARLGAFDKASWETLQQETPDGVVPALVGDSDTAMWGLQKRIGDGLPYRDEPGRVVTLRIVGMLPMRLSVFQGSLLISDADFTQLFPSESGFRAFLIDADDAVEVARRLNRDLEQYGMHAVPAVERLREFYAVESSYLAMFLVLGGLGLVLGAGGVGVVVLRNGFERRSELALLHAVGFERGMLFRILLAENAALAASGIGIGVVAAAVAVVPIAVFSQTAVSIGLQAGLLALIVVSNAAAISAATFMSLPKDPSQYLRTE